MTKVNDKLDEASEGKDKDLKNQDKDEVVDEASKKKQKVSSMRIDYISVYQNI